MRANLWQLLSIPKMVLWMYSFLPKLLRTHSITCDMRTSAAALIHSETHPTHHERVLQRSGISVLWLEAESYGKRERERERETETASKRDERQSRVARAERRRSQRDLSGLARRLGKCRADGAPCQAARAPSIYLFAKSLLSCQAAHPTSRQPCRVSSPSPLGKHARSSTNVLLRKAFARRLALRAPDPMLGLEGARKKVQCSARGGARRIGRS